MRLNIMILGLLLSVAACENRNGATDRVKPKRSANYASSDAEVKPELGAEVKPAPLPEVAPPENNDSEEETITPPGNISGASLVCSILKAATDADPTTDVGCKFLDADGGRAEMSSIAERGIFSVQPPVGIRVKTTHFPNFDWEVLYSFSAANAEACTIGALNSLIIVTLEKVVNGPDLASIKEELWEIELPLYEWVRACKQGACAFKQLSAELYWARSNGLPYNHVGAAAACSELKFASYSDWRLPTQDEMQIAHDEKITALFYPEKLNLLQGKRYWSGTLDGSDAAFTIDWYAADDTLFAAEKLNAGAQVLCVRK